MTTIFSALAIAMTYFAFAFKKLALALMAAGLWIGLSVYMFGLSVGLWDSYYYLAWIAMGFGIAMPFLGLAMREKIDKPQPDWESDYDPDEDEYQREWNRYHKGHTRRLHWEERKRLAAKTESEEDKFAKTGVG